MYRGLARFLSATVIGITAVSPPATAAVVYSFAGGVDDLATSVIFEFIVTTPQFVTSTTALSPDAASCEVMSPVLESCSISTDVFFSPRDIGGPDSVSFAALFKPFFSDFTFSQNFRADFAFPPGVEVFQTPGVYTASSFRNLVAATLQVSGFEEPIPGTIPEPSTLLLLIGGLGLSGAAARFRRAREARTRS